MVLGRTHQRFFRHFGSSVSIFLRSTGFEILNIFIRTRLHRSSSEPEKYVARSSFTAGIAWKRRSVSNSKHRMHREHDCCSMYHSSIAKVRAISTRSLVTAYRKLCPEIKCLLGRRCVGSRERKTGTSCATPLSVCTARCGQSANGV